MAPDPANFVFNGAADRPDCGNRDQANEDHQDKVLGQGLARLVSGGICFGSESDQGFERCHALTTRKKWARVLRQKRGLAFGYSVSFTEVRTRVR